MAANLKWLLIKKQGEKDIVMSWLSCVTCVNPPVLAGGPGVRGLVRVSRVLRLVVHVSDWRWADFASPDSSSSSSSSSPRDAVLSDSSQLGLTLRDGLGGESQRKLEQVNLTPEGIYLGGRRGGSRRREAGRRGRLERGEGGERTVGGRDAAGELRWMGPERDRERKCDG